MLGFSDLAMLFPPGASSAGLFQGSKFPDLKTYATFSGSSQDPEPIFLSAPRPLTGLPSFVKKPFESAPHGAGLQSQCLCAM